MAKAEQETGYEHPSGKRDISETKTYDIFRRFKAATLPEAQRKAKAILVKFKKDRPKRLGGISWEYQAHIVSKSLMKVVPL
ncbi:MAG: hypothetical protein WC814_02135 [Candidatus Paceibacterota bacterium]